MHPSPITGQVTAQANRFRAEHGDQADALARAYANALLSIGETDEARRWKAVAAIIGGKAPRTAH
jgi:hypothetical protein